MAELDFLPTPPEGYRFRIHIPKRGVGRIILERRVTVLGLFTKWVQEDFVPLNIDRHNPGKPRDAERIRSNAGRMINELSRKIEREAIRNEFNEKMK